MSKSVKYTCSNCGATFPKWAGKCESCDAWNTLSEEVNLSRGTGKGKAIHARPLVLDKEQTLKRMTTKINEVDKVLGGGFVPGSINLLAGEPGIGKSTLLLQVARSLADKNSALYISGEESEHQILSRAKRIGAESSKLELATSTSTDDIEQTIASSKADFVIIDSIQTLSCSDISSAPGSVSQITNSAHRITQAAKKSNTAVVLVGHVTKDGHVAGPKVLEHLVDSVLNLEGERFGGFRVLRSIKNRYGSTNETGIFDMEESGLVPVENASKALLSERRVSDGSIVFPLVEGTRCVLVEVQALVNPTPFGYPKRTASGFDLNRLNVIIAMLSKRTKLNLGDKDIFVNVVGGLKLTEPAADLAVAMAIASATKGMQLKEDAVVFGEVGLSGEVRKVQSAKLRLDEGKKLGFKLAIGPNEKDKHGILSPVSTVKDALNNYLKTK